MAHPVNYSFMLMVNPHYELWQKPTKQKQSHTSRVFITLLPVRNSLFLNRFHQFQGDATRKKMLSIISKNVRKGQSPYDHIIVGVKSSERSEHS